MTTTELLALFRLEVVDVALPYLWADATIYTYIDDAQKQFCRDTYGIEDSRSFKLTVPGDGVTEWFALDPTILKVRNAVDSATGNDIPLIAIEKMGGTTVGGSKSYGISAAATMKFDGTTGALKALITGMDKGYVRTWPLVNIPTTVLLRTFRLPYDVAAGDDFEIDSQHHINLLHWVKYRAYGVQDAETYNAKAVDKFKAAHDLYCAKAKVEQDRLRRPVSTVAYGGC